MLCPALFAAMYMLRCTSGEALTTNFPENGFWGHDLYPSHYPEPNSQIHALGGYAIRLSISFPSRRLAPPFTIAFPRAVGLLAAGLCHHSSSSGIYSHIPFWRNRIGSAFLRQTGCNKLTPPNVGRCSKGLFPGGGGRPQNPLIGLDPSLTDIYGKN
jgi:hypothetical protein